MSETTRVILSWVMVGLGGVLEVLGIFMAIMGGRGQ